MPFSYNKLWKLLIDKGINKTNLREKTNISQSTMAKLGKGENVETDVLDRICEALDCDISEIVEYVKHNRNTLRFIDLFAGMGGTRIGFEKAAKEMGFDTKCVLTSEIKPYAIEALKANFEQDNLQGDITKIDASTIPNFDFLLGGFPCQAFSTAGKGLGFVDTRGTMFFEVERILKEKKPFGFLLENVEGLVLHDRENPSDKIGRTLSTILDRLAQIGYKVNWKLLDSQYFGVAQSRYRVYIVGTLDDYVNLENFDISRKTVGEILESGLPCINSHFTNCLFKHFKPEQLYGKSIKDKRGGENNIHSWTIGLKGEITQEQTEIIEKLFKERRKKHWAEETGIDWMDGMPLTLEQISTFHNTENLKELLDDLVNKGYLVMEHPKKIASTEINGSTIQQRVQDETKPAGYNIVAGKLSFEFTKILDNNDVAPTLVAMDVCKIGVVDGNGIRHLSIREGLRLFGYPDDYKLDMFPNTNKGLSQAFDLLGNTVVVPVIYNVSKRLLNTYSNKNS